ncbi:hypothetical protein L9F63_010020, partial [Diploptera punctata]
MVVMILLLVSFHTYEILSQKNQTFYKIAFRIFIHVNTITMILQFINLVSLFSNRLKLITERLKEFSRTSGENAKLSHCFVNNIKVREQRQINVSLIDKRRYSSMGTAQIQNSTNNLVSGHEATDLTFANTKDLDILTELKQLRKVHHIICDILKSVVNSIYGIILLILSSYMFLSCVKYIHLMIIMVKKPRIRNSSGVVHKFYKCDAICSKELQLLSNQTIHSKLEFTAFDFFPLNFTYFHMFLAGVTTYTVILLQF